MDIKDILSKCDHTLLRQDSTWEEIRRLCDEGVKYSVASVCIPPSYVKRAAEYLAGALPGELDDPAGAKAGCSQGDEALGVLQA